MKPLPTAMKPLPIWYRTTKSDWTVLFKNVTHNEQDLPANTYAMLQVRSTYNEFIKASEDFVLDTDNVAVMAAIKAIKDVYSNIEYRIDVQIIDNKVCLYVETTLSDTFHRTYEVVAAYRGTKQQVANHVLDVILNTGKVGILTDTEFDTTTFKPSVLGVTSRY